MTISHSAPSIASNNFEAREKYSFLEALTGCKTPSKSKKIVFKVFIRTITKKIVVAFMNDNFQTKR